MDWRTWALSFEAITFRHGWSGEDCTFKLLMSLSLKALESAEGVTDALIEVPFPAVLQHLASVYKPDDQVTRATSDFEL